MKRITAVTVVAIGMFGGGPASAQELTPAQQTVACRAAVLGSVLGIFSAKMDAHAEMRRMLQEGLPALAVTEDPTQIARAERLLAHRIRQARTGTRRGDIFTTPIRHAFRELLRAETNPAACESVQDDNPGAFSHSINGEYPKSKPFSTMPSGMLDVLPRLPVDVQYRFLDNDLILHDVRANIILDRINDAIRCARLTAR